jgi:hypothetical protein
MSGGYMSGECRKKAKLDMLKKKSKEKMSAKKNSYTDALKGK